MHAHHAHGSSTDPAEVLRTEHVVIERLLAALEAMADRVESGKPVPRKDLEDALTVASEFADRCHHAKEESALFPVLERLSPDEGAKLAHRLHGDHEAFRKLVGDMRQRAPSALKGGPDTPLFVKNVRTYVVLIREHIAIETEQLLPMMDRLIPEVERGNLAIEFDRLEREQTGVGGHEAYEASVKRLHDAYIG